MLGSCASVNDFEQLNRLGEGSEYSNNPNMQVNKPLLTLLLRVAYGVVFRARERATSKIVALKQVRMSIEERQNGIPITALREISILRSLKHPNIVDVLDVAVDSKVLNEIYMVMEYAEQVGDYRCVCERR